MVKILLQKNEMGFIMFLRAHPLAANRHSGKSRNPEI